MSQQQFLPADAFVGFGNNNRQCNLKRFFMASIFITTVACLLVCMVLISYHTMQMTDKLSKVVNIMGEMRLDTHSMCRGLQQMVPNATCSL